MRKNNVLIYSLVSGMLITSDGYCQPLRSRIQDATKLYEEGQYESALSAYMDIELEHPGEPVLDFNIGNTYYQQQRYDEAIEKYEQAILNADPKLKSQAYFNIGNSTYQKALQSEQANKLDEAIQNMRDGIEQYKQAFKANPEDLDIKYNIEFVEREIKRIINKIKEQQEQQKNQPQGEQQDGEDQQQQQNQQGQQEQQQGENQQKQQDGKQGKQGEQDNDSQKQEQQQGEEKENESEQPKGAFEADNDNNQNDQNNQQGQQPQKAEELSREEAERLLNNLKDHDKQKKQRTKGGYLGEVDRDW
ncbi:MAG: tetratricopeptide repeat protein [Candidatus Auribacterota bacterium]